MVHIHSYRQTLTCIIKISKKYMEMGCRDGLVVTVVATETRGLEFRYPETQINTRWVWQSTYDSILGRWRWGIPRASWLETSLSGELWV